MTAPCIAHALDRGVLFLRGLAVQRRESRRWRVAAPAPPDTIKVYYGYADLPRRSDPASGGIVKVQALDSRFPNAPVGANLVYLISSALPAHAVIVARRARQAGARVVLNQNGVAYPAWMPVGWRTANREMSALIGLADLVLYQSRFAKAGADRFLGPARRSAEIVHNTVDTARFHPPDVRRGGPQPLRLLLAGSHGQFYRVAAALETVALLRARLGEVRLVIAGRLGWHRDPARTRRDAEEAILRLGLAEVVTLRGAYTQEEAVGLYHGADILLHTQSNDVCPSVVIEAMACGLPVAYPACGGIPELVGADAGIGVANASDWDSIVPPEAVLMADAVGRIWRDWESYSRAARRRAVERLDTGAWLDRHAQLFERVLRGPRVRD